MLVGLAIALLSILTVTSAAENLGETAWCLPALMLIMLGRTSFLNLPSVPQMLILSSDCDKPPSSRVLHTEDRRTCVDPKAPVVRVEV